MFIRVSLSIMIIVVISSSCIGAGSTVNKKAIDTNDVGSLGSSYCTLAPEEISCGAGFSSFSIIGDSGCLVGYECRKMITVDGHNFCSYNKVENVECSADMVKRELKDDNGCLTGYECGLRLNCPIVPNTIHCQVGEIKEEILGEDGCVTGYRCEEPGGGFLFSANGNYQVVCPPKPYEVFCGEGSVREEERDEDGCLVGYNCKRIECPTLPSLSIVCSGEKVRVSILDDYSCAVGVKCLDYAWNCSGQNRNLQRQSCGVDSVLTESKDIFGCVMNYNCTTRM